jgi:DNA-binding transcriptional LysR family regulator
MSRRLPSLNSLRAFEAVARHGTLAAAAEELAVTASAIGQQVRHLEDWLSASLPSNSTQWRLMQRRLDWVSPFREVRRSPMLSGR